MPLQPAGARADDLYELIARRLGLRGAMAVRRRCARPSRGDLGMARKHTASRALIALAVVVGALHLGAAAAP